MGVLFPDTLYWCLVTLLATENSFMIFTHRIGERFLFVVVLKYGFCISGQNA